MYRPNQEPKTNIKNNLSIFICPESTKTQYVNHIQRTGQWDHKGTEHCPKYIKGNKNEIIKKLKNKQYKQ